MLKGFYLWIGAFTLFYSGMTITLLCPGGVSPGSWVLGPIIGLLSLHVGSFSSVLLLFIERERFHRLSVKGRKRAFVTVALWLLTWGINSLWGLGFFPVNKQVIFFLLILSIPFFCGGVVSLCLGGFLKKHGT